MVLTGIMFRNNNHLTVLLPAYNAGPYLKEAIDSILAQTYHEFEFLIINDGSKDDTKAIIDSYKDRRIKVIHQDNKGLITTLNEGIEMATGNIIARMDADDVCLPDRLQLQMDFLKENPDYVMVGSEAEIMDKDGNYLMPLEPVGYTHEEIVAAINKKVPFIHPCVTFRKDAVIQAGLYPKNALDFEDHLLWKKLLEVGKVCNLPKVLLKVRFNPESVTIDERWRGKDFIDIRTRSIINGVVSDEDAIRLKELMKSQNFKEYRQASYYSMIAKKYLWNNPNSSQARQNLKQAIHYYPGNKMLYVLFLFSYLPATIRKSLYRMLKK
jgi:glycosyltransferase involved in cell wall biosynthesis